jgi:D-alanyl-D-alanine carboxypeptidase
MITGALLSVFSSEVFGVEKQKEFDPQTREKMEKLLDKAMEESRSPGALVGVWAPGKGTWLAARGKANLETGQPAEMKDKTRIGSITKTFVATAVLQLVDEGRIALDDPVEKYLTFFQEKSGITVRQLLNHSSGLFDPENDDPEFQKAVDENPSKALSPREIVERAMRHAPYNKPGEGGHYSNANYKALGLIVEKVTGRDLGTVLRNRIFDTLGLEKTVFATKPDIEGKHIHGYALLPGQTIDMTVRPDIWELWASGNMVSTLEEQKKWAEALGQGTLVSRKTYGEMTDWIEIGAALPGKFKYGLGVDQVGEGFIGHAGAVDGYYGRIANNPETDTTIVVFFNSLSSREDVLVYEGFLHGLIDTLQPGVPDEQVTPVLTSFVAPPLPARLSDEKIHVLYELVLTNVTNIPFTIEKLEAVDAQSGKSPIAIFDQEYIAGHSRFPVANAAKRVLGPEQSGFIRINLSFDSLAEVPEIIGHVLSVSSKKPWGPYKCETIVERVATAGIPRETGPVIGPPLKGGRWVSCPQGSGTLFNNLVDIIAG